ncbi:hypothetical protein ACHAWF_009282, partial [Thalassiosira exigua]
PRSRGKRGIRRNRHRRGHRSDRGEALRRRGESRRLAGGAPAGGGQCSGRARRRRRRQRRRRQRRRLQRGLVRDDATQQTDAGLGRHNRHAGVGREGPGAEPQRLGRTGCANA